MAIFVSCLFFVRGYPWLFCVAIFLFCVATRGYSCVAIFDHAWLSFLAHRAFVLSTYVLMVVFKQIFSQIQPFFVKYQSVAEKYSYQYSLIDSGAASFLVMWVFRTIWRSLWMCFGMGLGGQTASNKAHRQLSNRVIKTGLFEDQGRCSTIFYQLMLVGIRCSQAL